MTQNKTNRANLENKRLLFLEIGAIAALAILITAFEWPTIVQRADSFGQIEMEVDDVDLIPITRSEPEVLPPPPPKAQAAVDIIEVLSNDKTVDDVVVNAEADANTQIVAVEEVPVELAPEAPEPEETIFDPFSLEEQASYPGGELALRKFIAENIRYPEMAKENDIQGTVYVRFVVDKDGSVTGIEIVRGVDPLLDKEAERVISKLLKFKPAKYMGKAVRVRMMMPVKFVLQ